MSFLDVNTFHYSPASLLTLGGENGHVFYRKLVLSPVIIVCDYELWLWHYYLLPTYCILYDTIFNNHTSIFLWFTKKLSIINSKSLPCVLGLSVLFHVHPLRWVAAQALKPYSATVLLQVQKKIVNILQESNIQAILRRFIKCMFI